MNLFEISKANSSSFSSKKKYTVYKGTLGGILVYIGTTIQKPEDRFRWHRNNGKNFSFSVLEQFDNPDDMLNLEFKLIKELKPKYNKITNRRQNFNKKLSLSELEDRKGKKEWCQKCLKRHVNPGLQILLIIMNFERHNIDTLKTLNVGKRAVKKQQIKNLLYKEQFGSYEGIWMGMGSVIELIKQTKDGELIEIFKEDFLKDFAVPARKGEKWRWEEIYEIIPQFPNKGIFKYHECLNSIVASFANIP